MDLLSDSRFAWLIVCALACVHACALAWGVLLQEDQELRDNEEAEQQRAKTTAELRPRRGDDDDFHV